MDLVSKTHHKACNILTRSLAECVPKVTGSRVSFQILARAHTAQNKIIPTIGMRFQIIRHTTQESIDPELCTQHSNDRATLQVRDVIKDLVDIQRILDRNFNRMRCTKRVQLESCLDGFSLNSAASVFNNAKIYSTSGHATYDKLAPHVPF